MGTLMIFRNSSRVRELAWMGGANVRCSEIVRAFLVGERDLMKLARVRSTSIVDLQIFLDSAIGKLIFVERAPAGELLIRAVGSAESLLLTGRTAEVVNAYLDDNVVLMEDRAEMTIRKKAG
jgi:hypothetical protein